MIANETAVIRNSLWTATANPAPACPPLSGEAETEVAIVGGGFTGLSAALHLAEAGVSATVLEAETPGWGASGRNGGQVNPGLKEDPETILKRFGPEMGERMIRMSGDAADLVFSLIRRHEIDCAPTQTGWLRPFHNQATRAEAEERAAQWRRRGAPLRMLDAAETADMLGADYYIGAMIDERGGNLHPLNYALGLAHAAAAAGAALHGQSRALRLERKGDRITLHTASGALTAQRVLLCTNGYTDGLVPPMKQTVVPVRSVQVATAPLGDNLRRSILPGGQHAADSRRLLLYYRLSPEGRFVMGGRGAYDDAGVKTQMKALRAVTAEIFPQLAGVEWAYEWGGYVAMTADHYPHLTRAAPGVMAAMGYNGRGVAMATALGKTLADWAAGRPEADLDFPVETPRPIPFHFLRKPAVAAAVGWNRLRDRYGF